MQNLEITPKCAGNHKWLWLLLVSGAILTALTAWALTAKPGMARGIQDGAGLVTRQQPADTAPPSNPLDLLNGKAAEGDGKPLDCQSCHNKVLTYHDKLGAGNNACYSCHNPTDSSMKTLRLSDGVTMLQLTEAPQLCAQCHQKRYADWQIGTHGIPGTVAAVGCTACHNPHNPQVAIIGVTKPPPPPLTTSLPFPRDFAMIGGITVIVLLGAAFVYSRRKEIQ